LEEFTDTCQLFSAGMKQTDHYLG